MRNFNIHNIISVNKTNIIYIEKQTIILNSQVILLTEQ